MDAPTQTFLGEVFLLCSVLAEDAAPEVHPFLFILLFLHLLPSSELVLFVYMTPTLLAAKEGNTIPKCMFFFPKYLYMREAKLDLPQCGFSCEPN